MQINFKTSPPKLFKADTTINQMTYIEQLEHLSDNELCSIHNIYCDNKGYNDNIIFDNGEDFFDTYFGTDVIGAVRAVLYGDYNLSHKYVTFDGYANLKSFDNIEDFIDLNEIEKDIEDNYSDYSQYIEEEEEEEEE